jgi:hypothetical protein
MITLKQLAALHIDKWSGGMQGNDSQMFYRSTILKIRGLMNEVLRIETLRARDEGDKNGPVQYIASYDLLVTKTGGIAKVTLPEFYLQMPFNGGIYRVFPKDRRQGGFDFVRTYNPGISANTDAGNYAGHKNFWAEGKELYFRKAFVEPNEDLNVTVQIFVGAPDTVGENDILPISPDQQSEILRRLDILAQPIVPQDKVNNNNPNQ